MQSWLGLAQIVQHALTVCLKVKTKAKEQCVVGCLAAALDLRNPGKFEPCRRFEVSFHSTFLVQPGTNTAACLQGESYTEIRIFIQGQLSTRSPGPS